jgi:hypothetical protein
MTPSSTPTLRQQIEIDKMLRFAQWLFAKEPHSEIRGKDQPDDAESNGQCAA